MSGRQSQRVPMFGWLSMNITRLEGPLMKPVCFFCMLNFNVYKASHFFTLAREASAIAVRYEEAFPGYP